MIKNCDVAGVPKYRFIEFRNTEKWEAKRLGDICDILNNIRKPITSINRKKGMFPYYGASGIIDYIDDYLFDERLLLVGEDGAKWGAFENSAFIVEGKYWVNNHVHVLRSVDINDKLLESYLIKLDLKPYVTGEAPSKLTLGKLKEILILAPKNEEEQQKIGDCLSSLDAVIHMEEKKLLSLKKYKKGWLQKLFPKDEDIIPECRFNEFRDSNGWEKRKLREVLIKNCKRNKEQQYTLIESVSNKFGFVNQSEYFENRRIASKNTSNYYVIEKGCFAYNPSRIDVGSLAYKYDEEISIISPLYVSFKANNDLIDDVFLFYFFNSSCFIQQMIFEGGVRNSLSYDELCRIRISFPNICEQEKIAAFLLNIDGLINKQVDKIEVLYQHKKSLMQGLFPDVGLINT